jgi:maleate cis-trans isomerase
MKRLGFLTPFQELPADYSEMVSRCPQMVSQYQVITDAEDSHEPEDLAAMGGKEALERGVERVMRWGPDTVVWACTSGSFVFGREGCVQQSAALSEQAGVPATSTALAFVDALHALGASEVSVVSPYPKEATERFVLFLNEWDVSVRQHVRLNCPGATTSELLTSEDLQSRVEEVMKGVPVLVPDTAVWWLEAVDGFPPELRRSVLFANQVTLWHTFSIVGVSTDMEEFASLRGVEGAGVGLLGLRRDLLTDDESTPRAASGASKVE